MRTGEGELNERIYQNILERKARNRSSKRRTKGNWLTLILAPFIIIAFMAWGSAEICNDDILWRIIFDVIGIMSIVLGITLAKTLL